jgi:hypothetical protein
VIKAEMCAIMLRGVVKNYQTLYSSFSCTDEENNEECGMDRVRRFRANLVANLRGALSVLEKDHIKSEVIDRIRAEVLKYSDWDETPTFIYEEVHEEEISCLAKGILEKPYRKWLAKEKTKIRYNFADDAKRH